MCRLSAVNAVCHKQQTAAVGCHNDHPVPTITHHVNPPFEADVDYQVVSLLQKTVSLAKWNQQIQGDVSYRLGCLSVTVEPRFIVFQGVGENKR